MHGARALPNGQAEYRIWAPKARQMAVKVGGRAHLMQPEKGGFFTTEAPAGDYLFAFEGAELPDPASRHQPRGTRGPSRVTDPSALPWTDSAWKGLALEEYVLYELHVGTFTPEGTFDAIIPRLAALRDLGVTAIELMPVGEFPGARNWGYDVAFPYAPHSAYGGPAGLQRVVDACHRHGLAVVLDVVYNHLGPEDCILESFAPYASPRFDTPWGRPLDFDRPEARRFVVDNALMWLADYHVDALRLDAVHALFDTTEPPIVRELAAAFHAEARRLGRRAWLFAETDQNDVRVIEELGVDSHWNDDFHHALHALLTGARHGYFADFGRMADLAKAIEEGFVLDGSRASAYHGRAHGTSSRYLKGPQLTAFAQNHDQIANASQGRRLSETRVAAALLAFTPNVPLLFMGQEYGETAPFHYFISHQGEPLIDAVRRGRRKEFERFGASHDFPDPADPATFEACKLNWSLRDRTPHSQVLRFHRDLLSLRRRTPALSNGRRDQTRVRFDEAARWITIERGGGAILAANLSRETVEIPIGEKPWRLEMSTGDRISRAAGPPCRLPPGSAAVYVGHSARGS